MPTVTPDLITRYAHLLITSGCNLQPGQELYLQVSTSNVSFARTLTAAAYEAGARHVTVAFYDDAISRLHYDHCDLSVFEQYPAWQALRNNSLAEAGAAVLEITSEDPLAMTGIDPAKPVATARAAHDACRPFYDAMDHGRIVWCIAGAASPEWAHRVYPNVPVDKAVDDLWQAILTAARASADVPDPVAAWAAHRASFDARKAWLNAQGFSELHYHASNGTDLTVGLNPLGLWQGGGDVTAEGRPFFPNMPTEEIFSTPDYRRATGTAVASLPLVHNGSVIRDFQVTFKDGEVVAVAAREGQDVLESIIAVDAGARHLGEVSLVPYESPIRRSGLLFYNTLFDENAACHLALGQGFPDCLDGGIGMTEEELGQNGVNHSATHVDFMIGTADLQIIGARPDGTQTPIFQNGTWAQ
jgi:aminopeptidase